MTAPAAEEGEQPAAPVRLMWMRVTRIHDGRVVEQGPAVEVVSDGEFDPYALSSPWPPCRCPRHRERNRE